MVFKQGFQIMVFKQGIKSKGFNSSFQKHGVHRCEQTYTYIKLHIFSVSTWWSQQGKADTYSFSVSTEWSQQGKADTIGQA